MSDRVARLLPRLLESLDTIDGDSEIANIVRQIRTNEPGYFARSAHASETMVSLDYGDRDMNVRLRGLGIMLRLVAYPDPEIQAALHRAREAMILLGMVDPRDLVITMACLRDVILQESARRVNSRMRLHVVSDDPGGVSAQIRQSLDTLFTEIRKNP
jgi:hypothetical protein